MCWVRERVARSTASSRCGSGYVREWDLHQESTSGTCRLPATWLERTYTAEETGMADATADQGRRYVLDGSDEDLRRLLSLSESFAEHARRAFRRVGVGPGWTVIDCGGPAA